MVDRARGDDRDAAAALCSSICVSSLTPVNHSPDFSFIALSDVHRSIRAYVGAVGTRERFGGRFDVTRPFESVGEHFMRAGVLTLHHRLEENVVTSHWIRRAVPRAVR